MKLCVALDLESKERNLGLLRELKGLEIWVKVGLRSYLRDGAKFIDEIRAAGDFKIFLDLKLYDIPNTMADAAEVCANLGVDMFNIHASAGKIAMMEVMNRLERAKFRPLVLAVSALTSFDERGFSQICNENINEFVRKFAGISHKCGLDGMVCSVFESRLIKGETSPNFITLTPGIRPFGENTQDQKRVANLETAIREKSDFIVVGRPIYESKNPREIAEKIINKIY